MGAPSEETLPRHTRAGRADSRSSPQAVSLEPLLPAGPPGAGPGRVPVRAGAAGKEPPPGLPPPLSGQAEAGRGGGRPPAGLGPARLCPALPGPGRPRPRRAPQRSGGRCRPSRDRTAPASSSSSSFSPCPRRRRRCFPPRDGDRAAARRPGEAGAGPRRGPGGTGGSGGAGAGRSRGRRSTWHRPAPGR